MHVKTIIATWIILIWIIKLSHLSLSLICVLCKNHFLKWWCSFPSFFKPQPWMSPILCSIHSQSLKKNIAKIIHGSEAQNTIDFPQGTEICFKLSQKIWPFTWESIPCYVDIFKASFVFMKSQKFPHNSTWGHGFCSIMLMTWLSKPFCHFKNPFLSS